MPLLFPVRWGWWGMYTSRHVWLPYKLHLPALPPLKMRATRIYFGVLGKPSQGGARGVCGKSIEWQNAIGDVGGIEIQSIAACRFFSGIAAAPRTMRRGSPHMGSRDWSPMLVNNIIFAQPAVRSMRTTSPALSKFSSSRYFVPPSF